MAKLRVSACCTSHVHKLVCKANERKKGGRRIPERERERESVEGKTKGKDAVDWGAWIGGVGCIK